jgi:hypothetical protein
LDQGEVPDTRRRERERDRGTPFEKQSKKCPRDCELRCVAVAPGTGIVTEYYKRQINPAANPNPRLISYVTAPSLVGVNIIVGFPIVPTENG